MSSLNILCLDDDMGSLCDFLNSVLQHGELNFPENEFARQCHTEVRLTTRIQHDIDRLHIQCNTQCDLESASRELITILSEKPFDVVLIDNHWGPYEQDAGLQTLLTLALNNVSMQPGRKNISATLPRIALVSDHFVSSEFKLDMMSTLELSLNDTLRINAFKKTDTVDVYFLIQQALFEKQILLENDRNRQQLVSIKQQQQKQQLENRQLKEAVGIHDKSSWDILNDPLMANSKCMQPINKTIELAVKTDRPVMILGQTGTGKEITAKKVHDLSYRKDKPFIAVNCAAIPRELAEAELFGYAKGAFSGAIKARDGYFIQADGGTIFLDEIGDMPLDLQVKLLRVLQESEVQRVGDKDKITIDVRVISATNVDLHQAVKEKTFREDLFFRLHCHEILLPPLDERKEDIKNIIECIMQNNSRFIPADFLDWQALAQKIKAPQRDSSLKKVIRKTLKNDFSLASMIRGFNALLNDPVELITHLKEIKPSPSEMKLEELIAKKRSSKRHIQRLNRIILEYIADGLVLPSVRRINPSLMKKLQERSWPGNIRELETIILNAIACSQETELRLEHFQGMLHPDKKPFEDVESKHILDLNELKHLPINCRIMQQHISRLIQIIDLHPEMMPSDIREHYKEQFGKNIFPYLKENLPSIREIALYNENNRQIIGCVETLLLDISNGEWQA